MRGVVEAAPGGDVSVYEAFDPTLERKVALKFVALGDVDLESTQGHQLVREARAWAGLSHVRVAPVFDAGLIAGELYLAMELVEGELAGPWLNHPRRAWPEVLEFMAAIAEGLAAIHAAGLVHGAIIPEHVIVNDRGTPTLVGFQLRADIPPDGGNTRVVEKLASGIWDDIVALCLMLHRTMLGDPLGEGMGATAGRVVPTRSRFRRWPQAVVGFCEQLLRWSTSARQSVRAGERIAYPEFFGFEDESAEDSLGPLTIAKALRAQIEIVRVRRRRRVSVATAGLLGVGLVVHSLARMPEQPRCSAENSGIDEIWNTEARLDVERRFRATGLSYATEVAEKATAQLDARVLEWQASYDQACQLPAEDTSFDVRIQCLGERLAETEALVAGFREATPATVSLAVGAGQSQQPISDCVDVDLLGDQLRQPSDPKRQAMVAHLRELLAKFTVHVASGSMPAARALLPKLLAACDRSSFVPIVAEVEAQVAEYELAKNELEAASHTIERALASAVSVAHRTLAAQLATRALFVTGYRLQRYELDWELTGRAKAFVTAAGDRPNQRATLLESIAIMRATLEGLPAALPLFRETVEEKIADAGPDDRTVAVSRMNLAVTLHHLGRFEEATALLDGVWRWHRERSGSTHPSTLHARAVAASLLSELGRFDVAGAHADASVRGCEANSGSMPGACMRYQQTKIEILIAAGQYREAWALVENWLSDEAELGGRLPGVDTWAATTSARVLTHAGDPGFAVELARHGLDLLNEEQSARRYPDRDAYWVAYETLGTALLADRQYAAAVQALDRAAEYAELILVRSVFEHLDFDRKQSRARFEMLRSVGEAHTSRARTEADRLLGLLTSAQRLLGPDNANLEPFMRAAALVHRSRGQLEEAEHLVDAADMLRLRRPQWMPGEEVPPPAQSNVDASGDAPVPEGAGHAPGTGLPNRDASRVQWGAQGGI